MNKVKDTRSKVVFLQEIRTLNDDNRRVSRRWQGSVYTASFTSQARGVVTVIHNSVSFQVTNVINNTCGRYLIS